jgi:thioredoxin-related protein
MLTGVASLTVLAASAQLKPAQAASVLDESGLYQLPWFLDSFLVLAGDLTQATAEGKRFAILWGLRNCPYCKALHTVNFADPAIERYVHENFVIAHLNVLGAREVTDFDGEKLSEKAFAQKYGVNATPALQFFPENTEGLAARAPKDREVARMPRYLEPKPFLALFHYVKEKVYVSGNFPDYLKQQGL